MIISKELNKPKIAIIPYNIKDIFSDFNPWFSTSMLSLAKATFVFLPKFNKKYPTTPIMQSITKSPAPKYSVASTLYPSKRSNPLVN